MSKLRRNNYCSSPGNRNKASSDEIKGLSKSGKMKLNKSKVKTKSHYNCIIYLKKNEKNDFKKYIHNLT